jgi:hypothetical protein
MEGQVTMIEPDLDPAGLEIRRRAAEAVAALKVRNGWKADIARSRAMAEGEARLGVLGVLRAVRAVWVFIRGKIPFGASRREGSYPGAPETVVRS